MIFLKALFLLLISLNAYALSSTDKQLLIHKNIMDNGGFENGLSRWAASAGTFTLVTSGSNLLTDRNSATWDAAASNDTLSYNNITIPNGLYSSNGLAECRIMTPSGTATHTLQVYDGSSVVASVAVTSSTSPVISRVNFVFPSSGTITIRLLANANEPSITIDDCYLGDAANLTQIMQDVYSAKVADGASTTTVSDENYDWINGNCTNGSTGNYVCTTTSGLFSTAPNCFANSTSNSNGVDCRAHTVTTSSISVLCGTAGSTFDSDFTLECQATGADSLTALKADQTNRPWTSYTPTFTGFGTVASSECYWKRQGEDLLVRCRFTAGTPTATEARVSIPYTSKSTIATTEVAGVGTLSAAPAAGAILSLREASVAYVTFGHNGSGGLTKVTGSTMMGAGASMSFFARVPINGWSETLNAPLIKQSQINNTDTVWRSIYAQVRTDTSGSIVRQSGSEFSISTRTGTGDVTLAIASGTFSDTPYCFVTGYINTVFRFCEIVDTTAISTTSVRVRCANDGGVASDEDFFIRCEGPI